MRPIKAEQDTPPTGPGRVGCGLALSLTSMGLRVKSLKLRLTFLICQRKIVTIYFIRLLGDVKQDQGFRRAWTNSLCKGPDGKYYFGVFRP